ncbi:MAG: sulfotransferase [Hormoscilla sp.]
MKKIDLVFRTVGERTSDAALELAVKNIQPQQVHIIENVKPFSKAVQQMLAINYDCDFVVFADADCLIFEDMVPFLQDNNLPYVDCYVLDQFRGHIHCGVHITRIDVVRTMQKIKTPEGDRQYVLRPESSTRNLALRQLNQGKAFKHFQIFHDFFQYYRDIFVKYVIRELRDRKGYLEAKLKVNQADWKKQSEDREERDFIVANYAVNYSLKFLKGNPKEIDKLIADLPQIAIRELEKLNIAEKEALTLQQVLELSAKINPKKWQRSKRMKVFGIGLSRTGTKSLTVALNMLGINVVHYPNDETTMQELISGNYEFSLLNSWDGITDITVAPYYAQLDKIYPDSKFILTVREKESWLKSMEAHWSKKPIFDDAPEEKSKMQLRRLLRSAVYGTYQFNADRLSYVYDLHYKNVLEYFRDRPDSLLVINICQGEGWEKLFPFFDFPVGCNEPFPYNKRKI